MIEETNPNKNEIIKNKLNISNKNEIKNYKKEDILNNSIKKDDISNIIKFRKYLEEMKSNLLENFELEKFVNSGSESNVYSCNLKISKKKVAMKIISRKKGQKRNINELIISKKLKNKNIINFYGYYTIKKDELDCIIMEYAKFGNLRDFQKNLINRNFLSESLICFIAFQILNGLKYCHMCEIAHMDIKPQNITIDECLNVKIIDFSISLDYSKIKSNKIKLPFVGTNFYMAPEVIKKKIINKKDLNKVDLYSFGVVLYGLAFGIFPFNLSKEDYKDYHTIYKKIMKEKLVFDKDYCYSSHFIDFLKKLLEKDINKRININEALNHYWIKGGEILLNEKEKICNAELFLSHLITNHLKKFDDYLLKKHS